MPSLADLQRAPGTSAPTRPPGLNLAVDRVRTFDTPDFAGMTFLEVSTKTALNKVRGMPFPWSINPYRGCSHACAYCLAPDTLILMANGSTRKIADINVGDLVYGTVREGSYRRYTTTEVRDRWFTLRRAYRVRLEDGTSLVASGDHRFLTNRGWKHVVGQGRGPGCRPHLTTNNSLMGTGAFAEPPKAGSEYRRGYLAGVVRGDGSIGSYSDVRSGRSVDDHHRFRLAMADDEALLRSQEFLAAEGIATDRYRFSSETERRRAISAIRTSSRVNVDAIRGLIAWPTDPAEEWWRGFLAGIFDAEGGCSRGVLRISNTDPEIISWTTRGLDRFGITHVVEPPAANGCRNVRVTGGLKMRLRFFLLTDPAITRKRTFDGMALKSDAKLRVVEIADTGMTIPMVDITTGTGDFIANGVVSHNCFARPTHTYLNLSALEDFEKTIVVKTNLVEVLSRELAKPTWRGEHVAMGTNTDPYQRCEGRYRLMPGVIGALAASRTPFSILTKGTLITRDLEALAAAATQVPVHASLTIGMLDEAVWRSSEPGTPSPKARLDAVGRLNGAGIPTGVMLAPVMPGLNDDREQLAAVVEAAVRAGATHVTPIVLHLRPGVKEAFWPWLEREHPHLLDRYHGLYDGRSTAPKAYREPIEQFVRRRREAAWRRHGRPDLPGPWRTADHDAAGDLPSGHRVATLPARGAEPAQLRLL